MDNLIEKATTLPELNVVLENIYEARRVAKKVEEPQNSSFQRFDSKTIELESLEIIECLADIDMLMLLIEGYKEDIFERGSLNLVNDYQTSLQTYREIKQKLAEGSDVLEVSEEELKIFNNRLKNLLANAIKKTQLHLIFLDMEPNLNKAKQLCNAYLSVSSLNNILLQYHSYYNQQQVYQKYINIPSIYIFLGDNQNFESVSYLMLRQAIYHSSAEQILKCFVSNCIRNGEIEQHYKNYRIVFVDDSESQLLNAVQTFVNQPTEIQTIQYLSIDEASQLENTLPFLKDYCGLSSNEQVSHLTQLQTEIMNQYEQNIVQKVNRMSTYFRFVECISKCFKEETSPQEQYKIILSCFLEFRQYINKIISQKRMEIITQFKDLISTVVLAYDLYEEEKNQDLQIRHSQEFLFSVIVIPKTKLGFFNYGKRLYFPQFSYFYLSVARALESAPSFSEQTHVQIIIGYKFENNEDNSNKNAFKYFKDRNGLTAIMSLPTQMFSINRVYDDAFFRCKVAFITEKEC